MQKQRIAVIGGGLAGITTAYELVRRGYETAIFESREAIARETSFANGAMLTPAMSDPWNAPGVHRDLIASLLNPRSPMKLRVATIPSLFTWGLQFLRNSTVARHDAATQASYRLALYSVARTRELRERLGLNYDSADLGTIKLFRSMLAMERSLRFASLLSPLGLRFQVLDGDGALEIEPELTPIRDQIAGALYFPDDESGDAFKFCEALARVLVHAGGSIRTGAKVRSIAAAGGKAIGVVTDDGLHGADVVVTAAGNMTRGLVQPFGISLPIQPAKGYTVTFDISHLSSRPKLPVVDDVLHAAVVPIGSRIRVGGTVEFAGMNSQLKPKRIDGLYALLAGIYPDIASRVNYATAEPWTAMRPMSADGLPFIGPTNVPGLFVNSGHGHLGWTLAVGSAHMIADLIAGTQPGIDPTPYCATR